MKSCFSREEAGNEQEKFPIFGQNYFRPWSSSHDNDDVDDDDDDDVDDNDNSDDDDDDKDVADEIIRITFIVLNFETGDLFHFHITCLVFCTQKFF